MTAKPTTYSDAGVNIDEGDAFVDAISPWVKKTKQKGVLGNLGGYAGLFQLDLKEFPEPILASSTDGVGTKLKIAFTLNKFDTVGIDLVAMCVNDLICCGAKPLFFLDYFATGKLSAQQGGEVIKGISCALEESFCALIGGETAEMPGLYQAGEFDLAGFSVGVVNKSALIDGQKVKKGQVVIGVASSGLHSNGFSLVRKIIENKGLDITKDKAGFDSTLGEILLTPTRLYVKPVLDLLKQVNLCGIAHITGGGIPGNLPRMIPDGLKATINTAQIKTPKIISQIGTWGNVPQEEMWRVFNMGVGLCLILDSNEASQAMTTLAKLGFEANIIGTIDEGTPNTEAFVDLV